MCICFESAQIKLFSRLLGPTAPLPPLPPLPPYYSGAAMMPHPASHIIFGQHHSLEILPEVSAFKVETLVELQ